MGMFDRFYFVNSDQLRCAAGHVISSELQTKSLENEMCTYNVFTEKSVSRVFGGKIRIPETKTTYIVTGGRLCEQIIVGHEFRADLTQKVLVYTNCKECDPVYSSGLDCYELREHAPHCEWELEIAHGVITGIEPVKVESREDVRKYMVHCGILPLPDTDRVVAQCLEARRLAKEQR